jgi:hypothetical protein
LEREHFQTAANAIATAREESAEKVLEPLSMLPFLGRANPFGGQVQALVSRGLRWMMDNQGRTATCEPAPRTTAACIPRAATIVLCGSPWAATSNCGSPLKSGRLHRQGPVSRRRLAVSAWPPNQPGDTSVVGWQLMALQSARAANLTVPPETLALAEMYLDGASQRDGALYGYQRGHSPTPAMTAEGLLCRMYLGWKKSNPNLGRGVRWLVEEHLPSERSPNIYYLYYGTQTLHHFGGEEWDTWNVQMRDLLVSSQEKSGHVAGSWAPRDQHAYAGGRIYQTSLSICSLEVYYRHLPIFKQLELGKNKAGE